MFTFLSRNTKLGILVCAVIFLFVAATTVDDPSRLLQTGFGLSLMVLVLVAAGTMVQEPNRVTIPERFGPVGCTVIGIVALIGLETIVSPSSLWVVLVGYGLPLFVLVGLAIYMVTQAKAPQSGFVIAYAPTHPQRR